MRTLTNNSRNARPWLHVERSARRTRFLLLIWLSSSVDAILEDGEILPLTLAWIIDLNQRASSIWSRLNNRCGWMNCKFVDIHREETHEGYYFYSVDNRYRIGFNRERNHPGRWNQLCRLFNDKLVLELQINQKQGARQFRSCKSRSASTMGFVLSREVLIENIPKLLLITSVRSHWFWTTPWYTGVLSTASFGAIFLSKRKESSFSSWSISNCLPH